MTVESRLAALEARTAQLEEQLALVSSEAYGFKCAFILLVALMPISERDVERARQMALAMATDAIQPDEIGSDEAEVILSTVSRLFLHLAESRRDIRKLPGDPDDRGRSAP